MAEAIKKGIEKSGGKATIYQYALSRAFAHDGRVSDHASFLQDRGDAA